MKFHQTHYFEQRAQIYSALHEIVNESLEGWTKMDREQVAGELFRRLQGRCTASLVTHIVNNLEE